MVTLGGAQADTYGLCGVVHCLLHGKYMEVEKTRGVGEESPIYRPKAQFKRWFPYHGMPIVRSSMPSSIMLSHRHKKKSIGN